MAPLQLALVLHAHLPYLRAERPFSPHERWLHEAIWECYLPLCKLLRECASRPDEGPLLTLSVSPTLADMLADPLLQRRFVGHLDQVRSINTYQRHVGPDELAPVRRYYRTTLDAASDEFVQLDGDVLGALRLLAANGTVDLLTTSVSHAYLPGWRHLPSAIAMQLKLARQWPHTPTLSKGFWLPEMATTPGLDEQLLAHGFHYTIVDQHALQVAAPRVRLGRAALSTAGLVHLARSTPCNERVWSRAHGYPGHPVYREFHRDLGLYAPDRELGELRHGTMTGLKYHRIGSGGKPQPYDAAAAHRQTLTHALDFTRSLKLIAQSQPGGLIVAAYDAELFGHWWHEGPLFLRELLRLVSDDPDIELTTPSRYLAGDPKVALANPATSSWGRGGHGQTWMGERSARWWRPLHETHRMVRRAARRAGDAAGPAGDALDRAIVELLLLQSSDWLFMLNEGGETGRYGRKRLLEHGEAAQHFSRMALNPSFASSEQVARANAKRPFLQHVDRQLLRHALLAD